MEEGSESQSLLLNVDSEDLRVMVGAGESAPPANPVSGSESEGLDSSTGPLREAEVSGGNGQCGSQSLLAEYDGSEMETEGNAGNENTVESEPDKEVTEDTDVADKSPPPPTDEKESEGMLELENEDEDDPVDAEPDPDQAGEDDEEEEEDNDENSDAVVNLPLGRVKKIMKICLVTNEDEDEDAAREKEKAAKKKKGKKGSNKAVDCDTSKMLVSKEAIYLTAMATELFVADVAQQSGRITSSTKKKTMTLEHLKRALSDSECYEFLQGCFQPSIIIGD